ncbi:MAG TPA: recombinase RecT, partial [Thermoleophilia bacterium]|nr:recombinase RecT [Thermoleophilia bacterium]
MANTQKARQAVQRRGNSQNQPTIFNVIEKKQGEVAKAIGSEIGAARFTRNMLTTMRQTPKLATCTPESILGAMMQSAQLRLDPGPLQLVHFIPYGNKCQFQIGYRGIIELAFRAGIVITAHEVCEHDLFSVKWGSEEEIVHEPAVTGDRGEVIGYYAVARRDGQTVGTKYMTVPEVEQHR